MREAALLTKIIQERGCCNHSAHVFLSDNMFFMSKKNMSLQDSFLTTIETIETTCLTLKNVE